MEQMKSVTALPTLMPVQSPRRTRWPSHTGTSRVTMWSLCYETAFDTAQMLQCDHVMTTHIQEMEHLFRCYFVVQGAKDFISVFPHLFLSFVWETVECLFDVVLDSRGLLFTVALLYLSSIGSS